jgi:hypothetical protein
MENPQGKRFVGYQDTDNPYLARGGSREHSLTNHSSARRRPSPTHSGHSQPRKNSEYTNQNPAISQNPTQKIIRRYYVTDPSNSISATSNKVSHPSSSHYVSSSKSRDNTHYTPQGPPRIRSYRYVSTDPPTLPPTSKPQTTKHQISVHPQFKPDITLQSLTSNHSSPKSFTHRQGVDQSNCDIIYRPANKSICGNEGGVNG